MGCKNISFLKSKQSSSTNLYTQTTQYANAKDTIKSLVFRQMRTSVIYFCSAARINIGN